MIARLSIRLVVLLMLPLPVAAAEPGFPLLSLKADNLIPVWSDSLPHIVLPGQRTKITAPGLVSHAILGKIHTLRSPDTVVVVTDRFYPNEPDAWRVSLTDIKKYQIPIGYANHTVSGAIMGTVAGLALSTAFAVVDNDRRASERAFPYPATISGGGIIGALAGAITRTERWKTVPNDKLKLGLPLPQEPIPLHTIAVGERVRILAPDFGKGGLVGSVAGISDSLIAVSDRPDTDRKPRQVSMNRITLYQVSVGKRGHFLEGALAGIWVGFFVGTMTADLNDKESGDENTSSIMPMAVFGMIAGAFVGKNYHTDQWKTIPVERLRLP